MWGGHPINGEGLHTSVTRYMLASLGDLLVYSDLILFSHYSFLVSFASASLCVFFGFDW